MGNKRTNNLKVVVNVTNLTINNNPEQAKPKKKFSKRLIVVLSLAVIGAAILAVFFIDPSLCADFVRVIIGMMAG